MRMFLSVSGHNNELSIANHSLCTCHRLPRGGGGPRADVGEYGDFMGTLQQISVLVVGEMWGL